MERVLTDFVKTLRNANVKVSPAETLDAMAVIEKVGYDNKELLKNTLSLALPKTSYEKEKFEVCFDLFFNEQPSKQEDNKKEFQPPSAFLLPSSHIADDLKLLYLLFSTYR